MTLVVGHRGSPHQAPENTLPSFRKALSEGVGMVELDVHLCADGIPVVIHDEDLLRVAGSALVVAETGLDELTQPRGDFPGVPSLEEVLSELCPHIPVNVELKMTTLAPALGQAVAALLQRLGLGRRVLVSSFCHAALPLIQSLCPGLVTGRLYHPLSTGPLGIEEAEGILREPLELASPDLPFRGRVVVMEHNMVDRALVERFRRSEGHVLVYTVDEESDMRRCLGLGVDAIISNRPGLLRQVVTGR